MKTSTFLAVVIVLALVFRLTFTTLSDEPFSTDVWPLIRISEKLVKVPEVRIWMDDEFDGYNNRWPGVMFSAALTGLVGGFSPEEALRTLFPVTSTFTVALLLFLALSRLFGNSQASVLGVSYLLLAPPLLVFTSSGLKEVYALPLLFSIFLLTLSRVKLKRYLVLTLLLAFALSMSHHLASIMGVGILGSFALFSASEVLLSPKRCFTSETSVTKSSALSFLVLSLVFSVYALTYGWRGLRVSVTLEDFSTYLLYLSAVYIPTVLFASSTSRILGVVKAIIAVLVATTLTLGVAPIAPGLRTYGLDLACYIIPIPLAYLCLLFKRRERKAWPVMVGVEAFVIVNVLYVLFAKPELSSALHRILNYLLFYGALLLTYSYAYAARRVGRTLPLTIVLLTFAASIVTVSGLLLGFDEVSYYWLYRKGEVYSYSTLAALTPKECRLVADDKVAYALEMVKSVDRSALLKTVFGESRLERGVLVLYYDNYFKGVVSGLNVYRLDKSFLNSLYSLNRVFDVGLVNVYRR